MPIDPMNVPRRRKAIPKPFERKSISVTQDIKREWQHVPASQLEVGDIVAHHGLIEKISPYGSVQGEKVVLLVFPENTIGFEPETDLFAFTRVVNG